MNSALCLLPLLIAGAAQDDRWDQVKRELQSFAQDTLPRWGIKISVEGKGEEEGQAGFLPSRFKVTGGYETWDTIRMSVETGLGRSNSLSVGFQGAFKSDPNSTDLASGAGTISLPGGSAVKFKYTQDKGFELDVTASQQYTFEGVQIGDPEKNPFEFGFKVGPAKIRIDPVAYAKRFRAFVPNVAKAIEDKVGGVYINFDLGLLAMAMTDAPPEHVKQFSEVTFVSLKRLLEAKDAADLGSVTAIHGVILDPSERDVLLVGKEEEGAPRISVDVLVALLRSVWRDGLSPAVSIDPGDKREDDHLPRFGGVSSGLEESSLLRILFEADYTGKRLMVDTQIPEVLSIQKRFLGRTLGQRGEIGPTRFWYHPRPLASGDIWNVDGQEGSVWLFETGVQESTERMSLKADPCPIYEEWVKDFSGRIALFERAYPVYKQLLQVFELSLACTLLRSASGEEYVRAILGGIGEKAVSRDPHPRTFPVVRFRVETSDGCTNTLSGGVETRSRTDRQRSFVVKELQELLTKVHDLPWDGWCARLHGAFQPIVRESEIAYRCALADAILIDAESDERSGRRDEALAKASRAIEIDPEFGRAYAFRADLLLKLQRPSEALKDSEHAVRLVPEDDMSYVLRAHAKLLVYDFDGALADAELILERRPASGVARDLHARMLGFKMEFDRAIAEYTSLIEQNPTYVPLLLERGVARMQSGDLDGALEDYDRAIKINPKFAPAYSSRGWAKQTLRKDLPGAIEDYTRAIELASRGQEHYAYWLRGQARVEQGDFDGAIADLTRVIELDPGNAEAWFRRGRAKSRKKDHQGAEKDYAKAIELDPKIKEEKLKAKFNEMIESHSNGRYAESTAGFEELYWALPKDPIGRSAAYNVACGMALLGKKEEALDWLEKAVEAGYKDVDAIQKDPDVESLREEPRFKRILEKLKESK